MDANTVFKALHLESDLNGEIGVRNITCITTWCGSKLAACSLDQNCRDNMNCAKACGSDNSTCTFLCSESYQSKAIDNLMRCMFVDHKCLYLPEPDALNNAVCRKPDYLTVEIDHAKLSGTWKVNYGFNPDYDCFACQELSFEYNNTDVKNPIWYNAYYDIVNVKGQQQWNDVVMTGSDSKGIISLAGQNNGFDNTQQWYVLKLDDEVCLVYYCGQLMTWNFEGVLMMSRDGTISDAKMQEMERILWNLNLTINDFCNLNPAKDCPAVSQLFL
jgi:hypothetical protein